MGVVTNALWTAPAAIDDRGYNACAYRGPRLALGPAHVKGGDNARPALLKPKLKPIWLP